MKISSLTSFKHVPWVSEGCPWKWVTLHLSSLWCTYKNALHKNKLPCICSLLSIWYRYLNVFRENKLPYISSLYDKGTKGLSIIVSYHTYLQCFKQVCVFECYPWNCFTSLSYHTYLQCFIQIQVSDCYPWNCFTSLPWMI